ncbi:YciI family protein [Actinoallomurus sp. NPDC052274]|uniref:YciI family protein n=1 Tax=Actinoallomurus sp. NPDC052274 TaxID=3155420 RepID=UPI00344A7C48
MKYLLLVCMDEDVERNADPSAWIEEMEGRGVRLTGNRLRPVRDSTTVRRRDGELLIADGPFAETKEQIGGFDIL